MKCYRIVVKKKLTDLNRKTIEAEIYEVKNGENIRKSFKLDIGYEGISIAKVNPAFRGRTLFTEDISEIIKVPEEKLLSMEAYDIAIELIQAIRNALYEIRHRKELYEDEVSLIFYE